MIFKNFTAEDIISGRTLKVASGFFPTDQTRWTASLFVDNFTSSVNTATPSPSYGASIYDIRRTMYYVDVFPNITYYGNNDPFFSISYGNRYGNLGSGSFNQETGSLKVSPTKAVYSQYKNMLLNPEDLAFTFVTGSSTARSEHTPNDTFFVAFSTHKMKDKIDPGAFEISFSGSNGMYTFIDDSPYQTQNLLVYNLITGSLASLPDSANVQYHGIGLVYPNNGVVVFNAYKLDEMIGLNNISALGYGYNSGSRDSVTINSQTVNTTVNSEVFSWSLRSTDKQMSVRKTEFVPARHYFVNVKSRDFNYSNNPTFIWDGSDKIHARGAIRNKDFIDEPRVYITTVGLYDDNNELLAVAKLSRPALKTFSNEVHLKISLNF